MTERVGCPIDHSAVYPYPRDPAHPLDPSPEVLWLLKEQPISKVTMWNGKSVWLVTRIDDVRKVLSDRRFSARASHENTPSPSEAIAEGKNLDASFLRKDPPEHTVERRMWQPFFSAGNVAALRPAVEQYVDEAIDDLLAAGPGADLVKHLALPVPSRVISQLLAIPDSDVEFFQRESAIRANNAASVEEMAEANRKLLDYWWRLVRERLDNPGEDLVSQLLVREVKTGKATEAEIVAAAHLILFAGHDTTSEMTSLSIVTLLQNPDVIARMKADPSITPRVVEELLRYLTIVHNGLPRVALEDVEIDGHLIRAGDGVFAHLSTANRDESEFSCPAKIDVDRKMRFHVAFGAGPHACIGAPLARMELQVILDAVFRRIPTLRLAVDPLKADYKATGLFHGLYTLPVTWDA